MRTQHVKPTLVPLEDRLVPSYLLFNPAQSPYTNQFGQLCFGYVPTAPYTVNNVNYETYLNSYGSFGGQAPSGNFQSVLSADFPNWQFSGASTSLANGSLVIRTYAAVGNPSVVGAQLDVNYVAQGPDPTANLHWIQVVKDNQAPNTNPPVSENIVDNGGAATPFYDAVGQGNATEFYDFPSRSNVTMAHWWQAELWLVQQTGANSAVFLGGMTWGWNNTAPPVVAGLTPTLGPTTGGTTVTISGAGFTNASTVSFGGSSASFTVNSDSLITAISPPHPAGVVDVTVTTPLGVTPTTAKDQFTYYTPKGHGVTWGTSGSNGTPSQAKPTIQVSLPQMNSGKSPARTLQIIATLPQADLSLAAHNLQSPSSVPSGTEIHVIGQVERTGQTPAATRAEDTHRQLATAGTGFSGIMEVSHRPGRILGVIGIIDELFANLLTDDDQ